MFNAGQFLVAPEALFQCLGSSGAIVGCGLLFLLLDACRKKYVVRLMPELAAGTYISALGVAGAVGISLTLALTITGILAFNLVLWATDAIPSQNPIFDKVGIVTEARKQHEANRSQSTTNKAVTRGAGYAIYGAAKNPQGRKVLAVVAAIAVLLVTVGVGYAFTAIELWLPWHALAFSAGVGVPEEFTKAATGMCLFYFLLSRSGQIQEDTRRRRLLLAFAISGLGFGAGEALRYFGVYADNGCGLGDYVVRALFVVSLHAAWCLIVARLYAPYCPVTGAEFVAGWRINVGRLAVAAIPSVLLHGLYDALCVHENQLLWIVGAVSLFAAFKILASEVRSEVRPAQVQT